MDNIDLIRKIKNGELESRIGDSDINFYTWRRLIGALPEPTKADEYLSQRTDKDSSDKQLTLVERQKRSLNDYTEKASVNGWVLKSPYTIRIEAHGKQMKLYGEWVEDSVYPTEINGQYVIYVPTNWVVDIPEGYSVFYTSPTIFEDECHSTISGVLDADEFPKKLFVPLVLHSPSLRIEYGDPIAQIHPFERKSYAATASVETYTDPND